VLDIHGKKVPQQPHHAFNTSLLPLQTSKWFWGNTSNVSTFETVEEGTEQRSLSPKFTAGHYTDGGKLEEARDKIEVWQEGKQCDENASVDSTKQPANIVMSIHSKEQRKQAKGW
jgi:hypothetical protein